MRASRRGRSPNFVIIFLDDSGWADFHPFGNPAYATPNVETAGLAGLPVPQFLRAAGDLLGVPIGAAERMLSRGARRYSARIRPELAGSTRTTRPSAR